MELKHLAGYLPYRLKGNYELSDVVPINKFELREKLLTIDNIDFFLKYAKPILRPLSDLTKEIEVNGEKFVPLKKIGKIYEPDGDFEDGAFGWDAFTGGDDYQDYYYAIEKDLTYSIYCGSPNDSFSYVIENNPLHYDSVQLLLEWHFDIYGLIEKDLVIDINTLKL